MTKKAYFIMSNGTRITEPYTGPNKLELIKETRTKAEENKPDRGSCTRRVEDLNGRTVAAGGKRPNGTRWRAHKEELKFF